MDERETIDMQPTIHTAYYNEIESYPARWLENLIAAGSIAPGIVDKRDIREVNPNDIEATQAHFFAGIGVWSYALRLAGWPDDRPVWTGSCPCQPFSTAGKRGGTDDPRHLWPEWYRLIRECEPPVIFGEQVASKDGLAWLDLVYADLESAGYSVAAFDLCAAGVGAPHIRQRLYFVAVGENTPRLGWGGRSDGDKTGVQQALQAKGYSASGILAHAEGSNGGLSIWAGQEENLKLERGSETYGMGNTSQQGLERRESERGDNEQQQPSIERASGNVGLLVYPESDGRRENRYTNHEPVQRENEPKESKRGCWSDLEWLPCRDGKLRPTQPGLFPLAHGAASRVGRLRAYGNAIVAPLAAEFIRAYMET